MHVPDRADLQAAMAMLSRVLPKVADKLEGATIRVTGSRGTPRASMTQRSWGEIFGGGEDDLWLTATWPNGNSMTALVLDASVVGIAETLAGLYGEKLRKRTKRNPCHSRRRAS